MSCTTWCRVCNTLLNCVRYTVCPQSLSHDRTVPVDMNFLVVRSCLSGFYINCFLFLSPVVVEVWVCYCFYCWRFVNLLVSFFQPTSPTAMLRGTLWCRCKKVRRIPSACERYLWTCVCACDFLWHWLRDGRHFWRSTRTTFGKWEHSVQSLSWSRHPLTATPQIPI